MKLIFTISFCLTLSLASGQTFDQIISANKYVDCRDVTFNAFPIIEQLYANNEIDSIYQFLDYWELKCGNIEPIFRLRNILDIKSKKFSSDTLSISWIDQLLFYRNNLANNYMASHRLRHHPYYYLYPPIHMDLMLRSKQYDSLTQRIARAAYSIDLDKSLLLNFYASDAPTFQEIKSAPEESRLKQFHSEVYRQTFRKAQNHIAFVTGTVHNYGNLSVFGVRPSFGLVLGGKKRRHNYDVLLDVRAGPSKEAYAFMYEGSLVTDDTWTGLYLGAEYTFDFIFSKKLDVGLSPGIGYDRITALTSENDFGEDAKFLSSFNRNVGLVFKYKHGKNGGYIGLHFRYNWADYGNPGGTALDGEYMNIRLTLGSIKNTFRDSALKNLE